ncbi:hypothetical protein LTR08_004638 [Meristemomyces frigidus]|nr:hypothetical protein LTR08_004638 [Meristemomyces frigidus]
MSTRLTGCEEFSEHLLKTFATGDIARQIRNHRAELNWFIESITKVVIGDCLLRDIAEEILSPKGVIRTMPEFIDKLVDEAEKITKKRKYLLKYKEEAVGVVNQL